MTIISKQPLTLLAFGAGLMALGACASYAPTAVSESDLQGTALSRNEVGVTKRAEFLEIALPAETSELSDTDRKRIRSFVRAYTLTGHGSLVLSLPQTSNNAQLAVTAIAEARAIAWESGVEYDEISGEVHGAADGAPQPMILAYQAYDAIAPECASKASIDFGDIASNNTLPTLGCSVRTNLAAMIADPADLLGSRELGPADNARRDVILDKFRLGESTASVRSDDESGAVSQAVD
jgi:pilus assembly protein CpaD